MIIKSNFKDYYDYIEHINGGDPKVVYIRHRLKPLQDHGGVHIAESIKIPFDLKYELPFRYYSQIFVNTSFKWCIVAGKYYLIYQYRPGNGTYSPWKLVLPDSEILDRIINVTRSKYVITDFLGYTDPSAIELCKQLQQPVFTCINSWEFIKNHKKHQRYVTIDCEIPILQDLGFTSIIPPEQMYQDIAYFMSNTIRPSPDIQPPVEINEKDKIVSHGFDIKQSFRHRK